jgi:hypothetical protein
MLIYDVLPSIHCWIGLLETLNLFLESLNSVAIITCTPKEEFFLLWGYPNTFPQRQSLPKLDRALASLSHPAPQVARWLFVLHTIARLFLYKVNHFCQTASNTEPIIEHFIL